MTNSIVTSLKSRNRVPPLAPPHFKPQYKGKLTKIKESLGNNTNGCFKDKWMQT